jgi:cbb3-type cytochrome oxidase maturation protein
MSIVSLLLPLALVLSGTFVALFVWVSRDGQFDDLETPPMRAVFDDAKHSVIKQPGKGKTNE